MTLFGCFTGKSTVARKIEPPQQVVCLSQQCTAPQRTCVVDANDKTSGFEAPSPASALGLVALGSKEDQVPMQRNDDLIRLIHHLTVLEGGWWSWLSEACQATCDLLHADHACIAVLSTVDFWAATVACAGLGAAAAAGRAYSSDPRFNGSAPAAMLRLQQECPSQVLLFRSAGAAQSASASVPAAGPAPAPPAGAGPGTGKVVESSRCSDSTPAASPCPSQEPLRGPDPDLPGDWQVLAEEHGLSQFAAVALVNADMDIVGVLSLASKGPCRPPGWTPEALHSVVGLMAPHIRRAQAVLASPALSQLHAAATFSDLVNAMAEAAVEAAAAVAYVRGQSRVAFMGENLTAAAIFQQQKQEGDSSTAQPPLLKARRSSCEFVPTRRGPVGSVATATSRKLTATNTATMSVTACPRLSIDVASGIAERTFTVTTDRTTTAGGDTLKRESWTQNQGTATLPSFTFPSSKGTCKGHTLTLGKTLLSEALSKQVAGLCIDDCQAYTVSMKAYPRDLVLSRGAVMPLSLALATTAVDSGFSPRMALYVTYGTCLPRPLLQAVVQELQQLLQAMLPILKTRLSGGILLEYEYLTVQLQEAVHRKAKPSVPLNGVSGGQLSDPCEDPQSFPPHEGRMLSFILGVGMGSNVPGGKGTAGGGTEAGGGAAAAGSEAANVQPGAFTRISLNSRAASPPHARGTAAAVAAVNAAALNAATAAAAAAADRPPSLVAPHTPTATSVASHAHALGLTPAHSGSQAANATRSGEISFQPTVAGAPPLGSGGAAAAGGGAAAAEAEALEGDIDMEFATRRRAGSGSLLPEPCQLRPQSACEVDLEVAGSLRPRFGVRSVSFRLEAAQAPRGASKLAPLIASMHDRLKTAQAAQMTFVRSEAHKTDLKSLKLLQEIGQGGYGTVYRGTFHGTEVAVKIIKQSRLAGVQSSSNLMASSQCLGLHKQNLHDAIELVASVSMSHINIVQVPAYFMDIRLEKPEEFNPLDSVDQPTESRPFRLVHSPSLLESPAPGQEGHGAADFAMALVLEYCDCGSLCDAILNRKFIERVTPKKPPAGANGSAPPKTYLAINMRSVYLTLLEIALALRHMHSLALVHCDLKPQNVLLKSSPRDPRGFTAKLSDFGLAKMMAHDDEGQLVIDEAVASGTITHVAPEVLLGQKALGAAVDIYAFGILMFQVLCGMKVYDKTMSASAIANSVAHRFMRPQLPAWVPSSYRALAQACWHHVPSSRPTADELVRHLERALEAKRGSSSSSSTANAGGSSTAGAGAAAGSSGRHQQPRAPTPVLAQGAAAAAALHAGL